MCRVSAATCLPMSLSVLSTDPELIIGRRVPVDRTAKFFRVPSPQLPSVCRSAVAVHVEASQVQVLVVA